MLSSYSTQSYLSTRKVIEEILQISINILPSVTGLRHTNPGIGIEESAVEKSSIVTSFRLLGAEEVLVASALGLGDGVALAGIFARFSAVHVDFVLNHALQQLGHSDVCPALDVSRWIASPDLSAHAGQDPFDHEELVIGLSGHGETFSGRAFHKDHIHGDFILGLIHHGYF